VECGAILSFRKILRGFGVMSAITEISRSSGWLVAEFGGVLSFRKLWLSVVYV
jgi:hypothetical protein